MNLDVGQSFRGLTNNHHHSDFFVDEPADIESIFSGLGHSESLDLNRSHEGRILKTLSSNGKKYSVATVSDNSFFPSQDIESQNSDNVYLNSFHNGVINNTIYWLEWWPKSFKNTCIPISVK